MAQPVTVKERPGGVYTNDVITPRHHLYADEPTSFGSADIGPSPFEYLCAALGACTTITMRMYINRKGWEVDHLAVDVSHKRVSSGEGPARDVFTRDITIEGAMDAAQRKRILEIANKCPVHKTLTAGSNVITQAAH